MSPAGGDPGQTISEAASIALHAMILLAAKGDTPATSAQIAETFEVSDNHCAKVMQRLTKSGLVRAVRGPGGGFRLARPAGEITMLMVFEAIEGPLEESTCLFKDAKCAPGGCVFGGLLNRINGLVREHFEPLTLRNIIDGRMSVTIAGRSG